ncbi:MAG: osmoprotectant transport system permease protein [Candidatus Eremiobacteraeota bacterium]|jgi:osmoprotectant transport system permease protein|nr:osmoprotectant transport system permease protein [Candidatus Eremiobacteraeota bacterium]
MSSVLAHPERVGVLLGEHIVLVLVSLAIALAIALPLGVVAARKPRLGALILGASGVLYTIPSLALLALLVAAIGLGPPTAIVALVIYAQMVLLRGVVAGLRGVDPALVDAARGLGLTPRQTLLRVEFPAALPVVLGGVRIAAVTLVALATVAAWIQAGGLGVLLFEGLRTDNAAKIVAGALASALLAIAADLALRAVERTVRA